MHDATSSFNRGQEAALGFDRNAIIVDSNAAPVEEREDDPEDRREPHDAPPQPKHLDAELGLPPGDRKRADHGSLRTPEPSGGRRPWYAESCRDRRVPGVADEVSKSMIVSPLLAKRCHPGILGQSSGFRQTQKGAPRVRSWTRTRQEHVKSSDRQRRWLSDRP